MMVDFSDHETLATEAAGNWRRFESFGWDRQYDLDRPEDWAIVYTSNRDSGLLDQSNAAAIEKTMEPYTEGDDPDVVAESHNHWAVGHVDGYSIRVYGPDRQVTAAFRAWCDLQERLSDYPVLDEEDYSAREYEAAIENIGENRPRNLLIDLPDGWEGEVFSWMWGSEEHQSELHNTDDRGAYPSTESILAALIDLGMVDPETDVDD